MDTLWETGWRSWRYSGTTARPQGEEMPDGMVPCLRESYFGALCNKRQWTSYSATGKRKCPVKKTRNGFAVNCKRQCGSAERETSLCWWATSTLRSGTITKEWNVSLDSTDGTVRNDNGDRPLGLCSMFNLVVGGTIFSHRHCHKESFIGFTWQQNGESNRSHCH